MEKYFKFFNNFVEVLKIIWKILLCIIYPSGKNYGSISINVFTLTVKLADQNYVDTNINIFGLSLKHVTWRFVKISFNLAKYKISIEVNGLKVELEPDSSTQNEISNDILQSNGKINSNLSMIHKLFNILSFVLPTIEFQLSNKNTLSFMTLTDSNPIIVELDDTSLISSITSNKRISTSIKAQKLSISIRKNSCSSLIEFVISQSRVDIAHGFHYNSDNFSFFVLECHSDIKDTVFFLYPSEFPSVVNIISEAVTLYHPKPSIRCVIDKKLQEFNSNFDSTVDNAQTYCNSKSINSDQPRYLKSAYYENIKFSFKLQQYVIVAQDESNIVEVLKLTEIYSSYTMVSYEHKFDLNIHNVSTNRKLTIDEFDSISSNYSNVDIDKTTLKSLPWLTFTYSCSRPSVNTTSNIEENGELSMKRISKFYLTNTLIEIDAEILSQLLYFIIDTGSIIHSMISIDQRIYQMLNQRNYSQSEISTDFNFELFDTQVGDIHLLLSDNLRHYGSSSELITLDVLGINVFTPSYQKFYSMPSNIHSFEEFNNMLEPFEYKDDDSSLFIYYDCRHNLESLNVIPSISIQEIILSSYKDSHPLKIKSVELVSTTSIFQSHGFDDIPKNFGDVPSEEIMSFIDGYSTSVITNSSLNIQAVELNLSQEDIIKLALTYDIVSHGISNYSKSICKRLPLKVIPKLSNFKNNFNFHLGMMNCVWKNSNSHHPHDFNRFDDYDFKTSNETSHSLYCEKNLHITYSSIGNLCSSLRVTMSGNPIELDSHKSEFSSIDRSTSYRAHIHLVHDNSANGSTLCSVTQYVEKICDLENLILGYSVSRFFIPISKLSLQFGTSTLCKFYEIIGILKSVDQSIKTVSCRYQLGGFQFKPLNTSLDNNTSYSKDMPVLIHPNLMILCSIHNLDIQVDHKIVTILKVSIQNTCITQSSYGPHISQIAGTLSSISIDELSQPLALHTKVIHSFDDYSVKNRLDFHMSVRRQVAPLLEVVGENLRITYLQRVLITLISYIRDHFIRTIFTHIDIGQSVWNQYMAESNLSKFPYDQDINEVESTQDESKLGHKHLSQSQLRLSVLVRNFEAHFPVNSCGPDSMTILSPSVTVYLGRNSIEDEINYCKGPHLAQNIWISDLDNILSLISPYECTSIMSGKKSGYRPRANSKHFGSSAHDNHVTEHQIIEWKLSKFVSVLAPFNQLSEFRGIKVVGTVEDATFCSWCNTNKLGSDMKVNVLVTLYPALPWTREINTEIDSEEDYIFGVDPIIYPPGPRNTLTIGLDFDKLDWVITQGQYQALVNLFMQSFTEFQASVEDLYIPPFPKYVHVTDVVYGKLIPEEFLSLVTSVPVTFGYGRIIAIENEPDFYEHIHRIQKFHHEYKYPSDSIPSWGHHHFHRRKLFTRNHPFVPLTKFVNSQNRERLHSSILKQDGSPRSTIPSSKFSDSDKRREKQPSNQLFSIHFDDLQLHFYRRHFGGGNGIDVVASTFVITSEPLNTSNEPWDKSKLKDIPAENIIFAPNDLPHINPYTMYRESDFETGFLSNRTIHHIQYHQQSVANLRRCIVQVFDSVVIGHLNPIIKAVNFFVEPVRLGIQRFLALMSKLNLGSVDLKANLDLEVNFKRTIFCLPRITENEGISVVCIESDLDYTQSWRGFLIAGPGRRLSEIKFKILNLFIAPIHEIRVIGAESLMESCQLEFVIDLKVLSEESSLSSKLLVLEKYMKLSSWCEKISRLDTSIATRSISLKLMTLNDAEKVNPAAFRNNLRNSRNNSIDSHMNDAQTEDDKETSTSHQLPSYDVDTIDRDQGLTVFGDEDSGLFSIEESAIKVRFSIKDINFFQEVVAQLQTSLKSLPKTPAIQDKYEIQFYSFYDIVHLPLPTFYHPSVRFYKFWELCEQEILAESNNITLILRNNTYNVKVAKVELSGFQLTYNLSQHGQLHVASGGSCSIWSYNDIANLWEPMMEKATITLIAATDSTQNSSAAVATQSSQTASQESQFIFDMLTVRYDIYCGPVDLNFPQHVIIGLIRKLSLADVITTSSVHLPPYRIINELGVTVKCKIIIGRDSDDINIESDVETGNFVPIDRQQLASATQKFLNRKKRSFNWVSQSSEGSEHRLDISFSIENDLFCSKEAMQIDREGTYSFDMKKMNRSRRETPTFFSMPSKIRPRESLNKLENVSNDGSQSEGRFGLVNKPYSAISIIGNLKSDSMYIPYTIANMHIKSDGGRELVLRSLLTLKNYLSEPIHLSIRHEQNLIERLLSPEQEWHIPIHLAHPKSSLHIRLNENSPWTECIPFLHQFITQGKWAQPSKLKAEICNCKCIHEKKLNAENQDIDDFVVLLKPEVRETKSGIPLKSFIPVKYPTKESNRLMGKDSMKDPSQPPDTTLSFDDLYNLAASSHRTSNIQPMCIQILAPLQLCNVLCQPIIYRLSDHDGNIISEGVIISGEVVNIHNLSMLFSQKIYISIRLLNYCWSKWSKIFTRSNPYPTSEKVIDITLNSLDLTYQSVEMSLPNLDINLTIREHIMRISCPILISNRTGMQLDLCDSNAPELFLPLSTKTPVESSIATTPNQHNYSRHHLLQNLLSSSSPHKSFSLRKKSPPIQQGYVSDNDTDSCEDQMAVQVGDDLLDLISQSSLAADLDSNSDKESSVRSTTDISDDFINFDREISESSLRPSRRLVRAFSVVSIVQLIIHLPYDHFRTVEVSASSDWTLQDVFTMISSKLSVHKIHRLLSAYVFLNWESGQYYARKILSSPANEGGSIFSKTVKSNMLKDVPESSGRNEFDSAESLTKRSSSFFGFSTSSVISDVKPNTPAPTYDIPHLVQYDMIADCSFSILPFDTKVSSLQCFRLRLCHISEWNVYKQVCAIKTDVIQKEGLFNMFSRPKIKFLCPFMKFDGNIPFNPHRFLGFNPTLSLRVPNETDWSQPLDLMNADFGTGGDVYVTVNRQNHSNTSSLGQSENHDSLLSSSSSSDIQYEFGIFVERGKGFHQNITFISIVSKHIIISKFPSTLLLRQINVKDQYTYIKVAPETVQSFHFPFKWKQKLLQIRRVPDLNNIQLNSVSSENPMNLERWYGELDISSLGIIYVKLRNPMTIIKIQIEMVGASLAAIFSPQSNMWPPYRIDNKTSIEIRFRQHLYSHNDSDTRSVKGFVKTFSNRKFTVSSEVESVEGGTNKTWKKVEDDNKSINNGDATLAGSDDNDNNNDDPDVDDDDNEKIPWDYLNPYENVPYTWDYPKSEKKVLRVEFKQIYNAGENWNSFLWVGENINFDNFTGTKTISIKKNIGSMSKTVAEGYLTMYNPTHANWNRLFCVLQHENIFLFKDDTQMELVDIINLTQISPSTSTNSVPTLNIAKVEKYEERKREFALPFFNTFNSATNDRMIKSIDVNRARILQLRLAEYLGLFGKFSKSLESLPTANETLVGPLHKSRSGSKIITEKPKFSQTGTAFPLETTSTLKAHLSTNIYVDQLLEKAARLTFSLLDIVEALIALGESEDELQAVILSSHLYDQCILECVIPDTPRAIHASLDQNNDSGSNKVNSTNNDSFISVDNTSVAVQYRRPTFEDIMISCGLTELLENDLIRDRSKSLEDVVHDSALAAIRSSIGSLLPIPFTQRRSSTSGFPNSGNHSPPRGTRTDQKGPKSIMIPKDEIIELRFGISSLHPELFETIDSVHEKPRLDMVEEYDEEAGNRSENDVLGFRITLNDIEYQFICNTQIDYIHWIGNCRKSIEQAWVRFVCDGTGNETLSVKDFNQELKITIHADGPTSVLEVTESETKTNLSATATTNANAATTLTQSDSKITDLVSSSILQLDSIEIPVATAIVDSDQDHVIDNEKTTHSKKTAITDDSFYRSKDDNEYDESSNPPDDTSSDSDEVSQDNSKTEEKGLNESVGITHSNSNISIYLTPTFPPREYFNNNAFINTLNLNLFISVKADYLAFSIIDPEPAELAYIHFRDIEITADRNLQRLILAVTVQEFQTCNQLLNPNYPILIHPRVASLSPDDPMGNGSNKLLLPGLHQKDDSYPSLHLYFQQKLYHNNQQNDSNMIDKMKDKTTTVTSATFNDGTQVNLYYFERVTIWLAPMEMNLDDEIIARMLRYFQSIRNSLKKPDTGSHKSIRDEILASQYLGNRTWGHLDSKLISDNYFQFQESCRLMYFEFFPLGKATNFIYFSLLQLHPLDFVLKFRSLTGYSMTNTESAFVSLISQLDASRLCLNALIVQHAFGSTSIILDTVLKHYKASLWKQFHKLIGTDIVEGSVGLVSNLGTGVYDMFYEPIDGLVEKNSSMFDGLSKGGKTFASHAIGGTSSITSKLTGSIGNGVSLLTMDSEFYRNRANRRLTKAKSVSQGIYVGTKELGKNIVEGVSGIVVSPYRGWEENGAAGFGLGLAKGILGVAFKPAVGVFDLASRTSEGIRNSAFGGSDMFIEKLDSHIMQARIPRHFGYNGVILPYNLHNAAAQYMADKLTEFPRDNRLLVVFHQHLIRQLSEAHELIKFKVPLKYKSKGVGAVIPRNSSNANLSNASSDNINNGDKISTKDSFTITDSEKPQMSQYELDKKSYSNPSKSIEEHGNKSCSVNIYRDLGYQDFDKNTTESWGMRINQSYVVLITVDRFLLAQVCSPNISDSFSNYPIKLKEEKSYDFKLIWSCPASLIDQLYSDNRGDMILSVSTPVSAVGSWNSSFPVILDRHAQDYLIFQLLLEQTIGASFARLQPLYPVHGLIEYNLYKRYSSGFKSMLLSPTKHTYQLFGYVLYEYTNSTITRKSFPTDTTNNLASTNDNTNASTNISDSPNHENYSTSRKQLLGDEHVTKLVQKLFSNPDKPTRNRNSVNEPEEKATNIASQNEPEKYLSSVYPLVDIVLEGPYEEETGKFTVSLSRKDGSKMRILKHDDENSLFVEGWKQKLSILFPSRQLALTWRQTIEEHMIRNPTDTITSMNSQEHIKKYTHAHNNFPSFKAINNVLRSTANATDDYLVETNSIVGTLVIPTSGENVHLTEALKIEIARILRNNYI